MDVGISAYDLSPHQLVDLASAADRNGFASLWLGEHIALPVDYASTHPSVGTEGHQHHTGPIIDPATELVDPLVGLTACSAVTRHLTLATGIYLLPLRAPLATARAVHSLAALAGGRFVLGAGAGWLEEEFRALGVPFAERTGRLEESIELLRAAWTGGPFSFHGRYFTVEDLQMCAEPVSVPIVLGGNSETALRRAARLGNGWLTSGTPTWEQACRLRDRVTALRDQAGQTGRFDIYVRIAAPDPQLLERYRAEGFEHLVVWADQLWTTLRPEARGAPSAMSEGFAPAPGARRSAGEALADAAQVLGIAPNPTTDNPVDLIHHDEYAGRCSS